MNGIKKILVGCLINKKQQNVNNSRPDIKLCCNITLQHGYIAVYVGEQYENTNEMWSHL